MGKPRLPRGIQVTYADVSVAKETVGLSGASGAAGQRWCQINLNNTDVNQTATLCFQCEESLSGLTGGSSFRDRNARESKNC